MSQPAEGRPPLGQPAETLLRVRVRAERTESPAVRTSTLVVKDQQAVVRGRRGVAVGGSQVLKKRSKKQSQNLAWNINQCEQNSQRFSPRPGTARFLRWLGFAAGTLAESGGWAARRC